jgi:hypothetical protein
MVYCTATMPEIIEFIVVHPSTTAEVRAEVADALVESRLAQLLIRSTAPADGLEPIEREVAFMPEPLVSETDTIGFAPDIASIVVTYAADPGDAATGHMVWLED